MAAALEARLRAMAIGDVEAAISGGDVEAVRRWLETGGDVNAKGDSAGNWSLLYRGRGSTHPGRAPERYAQPGDATLRPARAFGVERPHLLGLGARPGLLS